jgi:hypothetical protein
LNQAQGRGVIWVPSSITIVLALNGPSWQGGHGKICKVWIENFDHVPLNNEFAIKTLKIKDNHDTHANFLWKHWFVSLIIWVSYNFMLFM